MGIAKRKGYWEIIGYPLSTWIIYIVLFSIAAAVGLYRFAAYFMTGTGIVILSVLFGLWTGARTSNVAKGNFGMGMLAGFVLGLIAGFVELIFILGTGTLIPAFAFAVVGSMNFLALFSSGIEVWIIAVMISALSSAVGSEFAR